MWKVAKVLAFFAVIAIIAGLLRTYAARDPTSNDRDAQVAAKELEDRPSRCEVWVGMTGDQLFDLWGLPIDAQPVGKGETSDERYKTIRTVWNPRKSKVAVSNCGDENLPIGLVTSTDRLTDLLCRDGYGPEPLQGYCQVESTDHKM